MAHHHAFELLRVFGCRSFSNVLTRSYMSCVCDDDHRYCLQVLTASETDDDNASNSTTPSSGWSSDETKLDEVSQSSHNATQPSSAPGLSCRRVLTPPTTRSPRRQQLSTRSQFQDQRPQQSPLQHSMLVPQLRGPVRGHGVEGRACCAAGDSNCGRDQQAHICRAAVPRTHLQMSESDEAADL